MSFASLYTLPGFFQTIHSRPPPSPHHSDEKTKPKIKFSSTHCTQSALAITTSTMEKFSSTIVLIRTKLSIIMIIFGHLETRFSEFIAMQQHIKPSHTVSPPQSTHCDSLSFLIEITHNDNW